MKRNNDQIHCRSCNAPMFWAETIKGKRIPIDQQPVEDGNIRLIPRDKLIPLAVYESQVNTFVDWARRVSSERYVSHFVTCPHSRVWRKPH